ncbi:hypothetical protein [Streptomyces sp. CAI-85]|uniref:hypothetical protein n=1 Tax=Streptomyces sp. CAI-85 TaxID=1472662 RepID=UPI001587ABBE|nr:hypothetical protein [Streptomyces sp. CAI-85]NUV64292.1 hypothetical protein [Streptomyces sp. CAI-85]
MSDSKTRRTPAPRLLIVAAPAGLYVGITQAAEHPVAEAAGNGALIAGLILAGPAFVGGVGKAAAASAARKKAKAKAAEDAKKTESK